jgi:hypothetical protein
MCVVGYAVRVHHMCKLPDSAVVSTSRVAADVACASGNAAELADAVVAVSQHIQHSSEQINPFHAIALRLLLSSKQFARALTLASSGRYAAATARECVLADILLYFYYAGLAHLVTGNLTQGSVLFELVSSVFYFQSLFAILVPERNLDA